MAIFAPQQAMMGRPGTGDPSFQRRQILARQLMAQQTQAQPVHSWGEALARALNPAVTAWSAKDDERTAKGRDEGFQKDYSEVVKNWQAGGNTQALAALLAGHGNKDVASLAPGQVIEDAKMQREQTIRGEDRAWRQAEADKDRAIAAQRHQESLALQRQAAARAGQGSLSQPVEVMIDGRPTLVRFNSRGGAPVDAMTGQPVRGQITPPPPQAQPAFPGNSVDATAYNLVTRGQSDPALRASPEYAAAWNKLYAPKQVYNEATGQAVTIRPEVPQGFQGPGAGQPQGAQAPAGDGFVMHPEQGASAAQPPATPQMAQAPMPATAGTTPAPTPAANVPSASGVSVQQVAPPPPTPADRSKIKSVEAEANTMIAALDEFEKLIKETPWADFMSAAGPVPTAGGARLNSAWANSALMSKAEGLYNLGVLNGPDLEVLRNIITDPSTVRGAMTSRDAYLAQTGQVRKLITSRIQAFKNSYGAQGGGTFPGQAPAEAATPRKRQRYNPQTGDFE